MKDLYDVIWWQDNEYAVYNKGESPDGEQLFVGTIEQVNAWLDLKAKGFNL